MTGMAMDFIYTGEFPPDYCSEKTSIGEQIVLENTKLKF
jgi:hypothetical protein